MKIKTFIAEDEPNSRERIRELSSEHPELTLIGEAGDGNSAISKINELKPDLLLLDIQMPGASGFQVLEQIQHDPMVIFVTAFDKYAIRAFEEKAVDYILKPISQDRFSKAIKRVLELNNRISDMDLIRLKKILQEKDHLQRFIVKLGDEIRIISSDDVYFFQTENKYTLLHTRDKQYILDMTLKELEQSLDVSKFCRIHKSYIVAIDKINKIKKWFHSEYILEMKDIEKFKLKVSRNYKASLMEKLR